MKLWRWIETITMDAEGFDREVIFGVELDERYGILKIRARPGKNKALENGGAQTGKTGQKNTTI